MAASRALRRLLRIRELEEEQTRLALESTLGELNRLQNAMRATVERERQGRRLVEASARTGELPDRLAGIEEAHAADRLFAVLGPRIAAKEEESVVRRQEFMIKRIERRQAETLIEEAEAEEAIEADRRSQQALDDWYGSRQHHGGGDSERAKPDSETCALLKPAQAAAPGVPDSPVVGET
ncbi:MAG: hypothetical protein ABR905_05610 [Terracidiphilus sp.]|jgi:hypothetical protein